MWIRRFTLKQLRGRHLSTKRVYSQFGWSLFTESHCAHVIFLRTYKVTTYSPVLSCLIQVFAKKKGESYVSRKEDQCWAGLVLLRCSGYFPARRMRQVVEQGPLSLLLLPMLKCYERKTMFHS
jgi:hypothetical protein